MRTRVVGAVAGTALLLAAGTATAAAAPSTYGIPERAGGIDVASLLTGRVTLARADAPADLAQQTLRVYAYENSVTRGDTTLASSRSWIVKRPGPTPVFGSFAPFTVTGHAGGTTVSATIVQVQVVAPTSATYLPLAISTRTVGDTGSTTTVRASTLLQVTAATVDGAAVDVGATCTTAQTLTLRLAGDPGFSDLLGGLLRGTFAVPTFTGCDAATRGTSSVLTAAFAGPGNTVVLARGSAGSWDTGSPRDCRNCGRPPAIP